MDNTLFLFKFEQTFLLVTKQNVITYNVQYMSMLRTVCPNQLAEAVCQRCPMKRWFAKHMEKVYRGKPMTHSSIQLQNLSGEHLCGAISDLLKYIYKYKYKVTLLITKFNS